ncbi:MAG: iron-containing alcohol dehydrogenase [Acidobacteria bacterium]|nr:iron-containing alcohol dehydrogenase [Acidobacteriota bacterium]
MRRTVSPSPELVDADPADLESLRKVLAAADPDGRLAPVGMQSIRIGADVLGELPDSVSALAGPGEVAALMDATPMHRNGCDLKAATLRLLGERFPVVPVVVGKDGREVHADENVIRAVESAIRGAGCVVAIGSGTITDIGKEATARAGRPPLIVVQTAASVNAFSDDMAVILKDGVKRTVPSRWPDALLIDLGILAGAPQAMNRAGLGDLLAMWTAPADWYLAGALGLDDSYHPAPAAMLLDQGRALLESAAALRRLDAAALEKLARVLTLSGIALGIARSTAPLSGTEHLVSHLIDMEAERSGRRLALHGAQVGIASVVLSVAWQWFLESFDPARVAPDACFPRAEALEPSVRDAFMPIDPSGRAGQECWNQYSRKLARWSACRPRVEAFLSEWPRHRARLREMTLPPERLATALREAGAPMRFSELDPPVAAETALWAFRNCHLMRNRFTLADFLFFTGRWTDGLLDGWLARAREIGGGL